MASLRDCGGPHRMTPFGAQPLLGAATKALPRHGIAMMKVVPFRYRRKAGQSGISRGASGRWDLDEQRRTDHPIGESGARQSNRGLLSLVESGSAEKTSAPSLDRANGRRC